MLDRKLKGENFVRISSTWFVSQGLGGLPASQNLKTLRNNKSRVPLTGPAVCFHKACAADVTRGGV